MDQWKENDIEELKITHEDITMRTPLRNTLYKFKGFQEKQELFGLRKGGINTRKNEQDMEGKEKGRKEAVERNVVHSGLFDIKKNVVL